MVSFIPLYTFLLCVSYASVTPSLGCCSELQLLHGFLHPSGNFLPDGEVGGVELKQGYLLWKDLVLF